MKFAKLITTIDTHTQGEPTRIVTSGAGPVPGKSMMEKKKWMARHNDSFRQMLMWEPRGHENMFGAIITDPCNSEAHVGVIFMDGEGYLDMCGHGSMGIVTALLETGFIEMFEKTREFWVCLDTPAGLIHCRARIDEQGNVKTVTVRNQPSFWIKEVSVDIGLPHPVPVNIAYGGNYFALVNASDVNLDVKYSNIESLKQFATKIRVEANKQIKIIHPATGLTGQILLTEIYQESSPPRNIVVFGDNQIDRSPCGTGTSAKMAFLHHMGRLNAGEAYPYQSIFGTQFTGKIVETQKIGEITAITPEITGSAFITGFHQFTADPEDIYKHGFKVS